MKLLFGWILPLGAAIAIVACGASSSEDCTPPSSETCCSGDVFGSWTCGDHGEIVCSPGTFLQSTSKCGPLWQWQKPDAAAADAGDDAADADDASVCASAPGRFFDVVAKWSRSTGACATDADCQLVTPKLTCEAGAAYEETCAMPLNGDSARGLDDDLRALEADVCGAGCTFSGSAHCPAVLARCDRGECALAPAAP